MITKRICLYLMISLIWPVFLGAKEDQGSQAKVKLAQSYKQIGDRFSAKGYYSIAANYYLQALSLARDSFSQEERVRLAIYLSWGGKLKESLEELRLVLSENPASLTSRLHFARVLSWMGKFKLALEEVNLILKDYPQNLEALLIKADILRWSGDWTKAKPLYEKILEKQENFQARIGLSYISLHTGQRKQAINHLNLLKPEYPYQKKETERLARILNAELENSFEIRGFYYHDEDRNEYFFYPLNFTFWLNNWKIDLSYRHRQAKDRLRQLQSNDLSITSYARPKDFWGISGAVGCLQFGESQVYNYLTFNLKTDFLISRTKFSLRIAREGFTETAVLIKNKIRFINISSNLSQQLSERLSFFTSFSHRDYSDKNKANEFQVALAYHLNIYQPSFDLGCRIRYLNFERQSFSGYFDPKNYLSSQIYTTLYAESLRFYFYFEPYSGYQTYYRYEQRINNWLAGAILNLGWRPLKNLFLAIHAESGNLALATPPGWRYYLLGLRLFISL
ncbi:MAG: hypothetical protein N3B16_10430 [Candidatus Aminicenantes bacterium]|nr:hypothetical protein [Candidatus Aminicenantes bacterium]